MLFFLHLDFVNAILDLVSTVQLFRAIGKILGATGGMPDLLLRFYNKLGLFSLDMEFTLPGCAGTPSAFPLVAKANAYLVGFSFLPVLLLLPLPVLYFRLQHAAEKRSATSSKAATARALRWYHYWSDRLVFGVLVCIRLAAMIITSVSVGAVFCVQFPDGRWRLEADKTLVCFSTAQMWLLHLIGLAGCAAMLLVYPCIAWMKLRHIKTKGLEEDKRHMVRYGWLYGSHSPEWFYFGLAIYSVEDVVLNVLGMVLPSHPTVLNSISAAVLLAYAAFQLVTNFVVLCTFKGPHKPLRHQHP